MGIALDYAPSQPFYRVRWFRRAAVWAVVVMAVGVAVYWKGEWVYRRGRFLYWQHRCMEHVDAAGTVAMDVPAAPAGSPWRGVSSGMSSDFPELMGMERSCDSPGFGTGIVFAGLGGEMEFGLYRHRIVSPAGERMVMGFAHSHHAGVSNIGEEDAGFSFLLMKPGGIVEDVEAVGNERNHFDVAVLRPGDAMRVYAGQPDPADGGAFFVDFELNGVRHRARFAINATGDELGCVITPPM
jgi:hypothetical protein